jgi:SOS-response transcriptional repressor LexA
MVWHTRLKALVAERGMSLAELSRRSGVNYDNVTKYVGGAVENPRGKTLEKLASALGTTTLYLREGLTDRKPLTVGSIPYRGVVAAGLWAEAGDALSEPEEWLPFNPVPQYPEGAVYCLTVQGDSLDKIAPHGTTLVVVDLLASGIPIRAGDLVVVERSRDGGGLVETTAKRVREANGGLELYPESNNPKWQPIMIPRANDQDVTIRVIGRVEFILNKP